MKKASIFFAILLCISIAGTVIAGIFAANDAMNGQSFRGILGSINTSLSELTDRDWFTDVSANKQKIGEQTQEISTSNTSDFTINAENTAVFLKPATDGKTRAVLEVFQNGPIGSKDDYQLELKPGKPYKINVRYQGPDQTWDVENSVNNDSIRHHSQQLNARLTVYLPVRQDLSIISSIHIGLFSVEGLTAGNLKSMVNIGLIHVKNCTIDTADLEVETGLLDTQGNQIKKHLRAFVDTGLNNVSLKKDLGCNLDFTINVGKASCVLNTQTGSTTDYSRNFMVSGHQTMQYLGGGYSAVLYMGTGMLNIRAD